MSLTRVTSSVISSNVITSDLLQNNIIQARHIQPGAITTDLLEASGNAAAVEIRVNANLDIVQDNVAALVTGLNGANNNIDTVQTNVYNNFTTVTGFIDLVQDNVVAAEANVTAVEFRRDTNTTIFTDAFTGTNAAIAAITDGTTAFTGPVTMQDTLTVQGNLIVVGAQVDLGIVSAQVDDPTLLLAANTPADQGLPVDAGILINRGANANVFFGFAQYGDHIDFIFTDAPGDNVVHYAIAYVDVHANSFGTDATHSTSYTGFHHADHPTTGIWFPPGEGTLEFASGGSLVANVSSTGNLRFTTGGFIEGPNGANSIDLDDDELADRTNSVTIRSAQSVGVFLDIINDESGNFFSIYDGEDDPNAVTVDDALFSVRDTGDVFVSQSINIGTTANVAGVDLVSNDYVTYTRLNANLNSTTDNVNTVTDNVNTVQDNVAALTGGATLLTPFTNVNTALGTSNVFFIGTDCANDSNVLVVTLDGIRQHPTLDWVGNYSNDTVQFVDATIPSGIIVSITSLSIP